MKKRVGAIEEFEFLPLTEGRQLHITIAITGWLCAGKYGKNKMRKWRGAWQCLCCSSIVPSTHLHRLLNKTDQLLTEDFVTQSAVPIKTEEREGAVNWLYLW